MKTFSNFYGKIRNNWNLLNELKTCDHLLQGNKSGPQKKWSVYEGVKMMVTSTFLTGQQEPPRLFPKTAMPTKNGKGHLPYNGDTSKTYDLSSAFTLATSISHIQK